MQPIGKLHKHDAHVVDHRQQHFANVLGLLLFPRDIADLSDLRQTVNQMGDLFAEEPADGVELNQRVFDNVVKQAGSDRHLVELHVGENVRYLERVNEVRLARRALLALVFFAEKR